MSSAYALRDDHRILRFAESEEVSEREVIEFWLAHNAMKKDEAQRRVSEVCMVAVTGSGELCGLTTAYLDYSPHLRARLWHVRGMVDPDQQGRNVAANLLIETTRFLEQEYTSGRDTRAPGILMVIQNHAIERRFPFAVWPEVWFAFVGVTPRGSHLRLHWFPGAEVMPGEAD